MAEEKKNQPEKELQKTVPPAPPKAGKKVDGSVDTTPKAAQKEEESPKVQGQTTKDKSHKKWRLSDKISAAGVLVNAIMIFATYMLFREAQRQTENANLSIKEAAKANSISDSNYKLAREIFESGKISDVEKTAMSKKSLDAQIASLEDARIQFEKLNQPYLQYRLVCTYIDDKKTLVFTPSILNYGKYPAFITNYNILIGWKEYDDKEFDKLSSKFEEHNLVSIDNPMVISSVDAQGLFYSQSKIQPLFIRGEIIYKNLMKGVKMKYAFKLKFVTPDAIYYYDRKDEIISNVGVR